MFILPILLLRVCHFHLGPMNCDEAPGWEFSKITYMLKVMTVLYRFTFKETLKKIIMETWK